MMRTQLESLRQASSMVVQNKHMAAIIVFVLQAVCRPTPTFKKNERRTNIKLVKTAMRD